MCVLFGACVTRRRYYVTVFSNFVSIVIAALPINVILLYFFWKAFLSIPPLQRRSLNERLDSTIIFNVLVKTFLALIFVRISLVSKRILKLQFCNFLLHIFYLKILYMATLFVEPVSLNRKSNISQANVLIWREPCDAGDPQRLRRIVSKKSPLSYD